MALTIGSGGNGALASGLQGLHNGMARASEAAQSLVSAGIQSGDVGSMAASLVDLKASEQLVKASAAVVKSADEMVGTLIDIQV